MATKARLLGNLISQGQPLLEGFVTQQYVDNKITQVVGAAPQALDTLKEIADQLANDQSAISAITNTLAGKANTSSLSVVATSGSYADLSNKPTLFSGSYTDLSNKPTLFSGSYTDLTNKPTLFSGSYTDLTNKPTTLSGYGITDGFTLPNQTGQSGKYLTTDGSNSSWGTVVSGPSITSLVYSANDLATDTTTPLPVTIIGSGFVANSKVYIDTVTNANSATALQFSGTTQITFTPPAKSAASYNVWVVTPDGKMAVLVNGILYSGTPSWAGVTTNYSSGTAVSIQLTAASVDTPLVYSLVSGTLPTGVTLSSSGLLSGTVTGLVADTNFPNIVINASDPQNQDASITIQLNISVIAQISRSLRFNSYDSANLTRTPGSAGNRKTWTWSGWLKRSNLGTDQTIFEVFNGNNDNQTFNISWNSADRISIGAYNVFWLQTSGVYRDLSAWYHIVCAVDTTQATANNRIRLYVNGSEVTAFSTRNNPSQNADLSINQAAAHYIGSRNGGSIFLDGYMAEVNFVDGQALTPSSFGQTDTRYGVWAPKRYTGSYGTNGFYLNFADNSATTAITLGKDNSGNNNWTPNNFSVTAGNANDSFVDSPTSYGVDTGLGGEVRGNYCTLNNNARSSAALIQDGGLYLTATNNLYHAALGTFGANTGKWYFEIFINQLVAAPDIGWHESEYTGGQLDNFNPNSRPGGYCIATDGNGNNTYIYNNGTATQVSSSGWTTTSIIGCAIDMDTKKIWFHRNGTYYPATLGGTVGNPATGTNPTMTYTYSGILIPRTSTYGSSYSVYVNFGQRPFAHTAPSGYKALSTQNLPAPTIGSTNSTLAGKYFNTVTWTGTGTNPRQITGAGFQPDFVWTYRRDVGYGGWIYDVLRGAGAAIKPESTDVGYTYNQVSSFDADGFTQTGLEDQGNNVNGGQYVAWMWKAGGAGVTNTQGTITSTVSANTASGMSIVRWTGPGTGDRVGHGLGVTPKFIIVRPYSEAGQGWICYMEPLGISQYIFLNNTNTAGASSNYWSSTPPNSTTFGVFAGGAANNNRSGNMIAYCFAEVPGFSKIGTYTGNFNAEGPFVYTGFRPEYIMVRNISIAENWIVKDTVRNPFNVSASEYLPNSGGAEGNTTPVDILSNGFKIRAANGGLSGSGNTIFYMAFAETPFKYALAR